MRHSKSSKQNSDQQQLQSQNNGIKKCKIRFTFRLNFKYQDRLKLLIKSLIRNENIEHELKLIQENNYISKHFKEENKHVKLFKKITKFDAINYRLLQIEVKELNRQRRLKRAQYKQSLTVECFSLQEQQSQETFYNESCKNQIQGINTWEIQLNSNKFNEFQASNSCGNGEKNINKSRDFKKECGQEKDK